MTATMQRVVIFSTMLSALIVVEPRVGEAQAYQQWPGLTCQGAPDAEWRQSSGAWYNDSATAEVTAYCPVMRTTNVADTYCVTVNVSDSNNDGYNFSCRPWARGATSVTLGSAVSNGSDGNVSLTMSVAVGGSDSIAFYCSVPREDFFISTLYSTINRYSVIDSSCP